MDPHLCQPRRRHTDSAGWLRPRHPFCSHRTSLTSPVSPCLDRSALTRLLQTTDPQPSPPAAQSPRDPEDRATSGREKHCACAKVLASCTPNEWPAFSRTPFPRRPARFNITFDNLRTRTLPRKRLVLSQVERGSVCFSSGKRMPGRFIVTLKSCLSVISHLNSFPIVGLSKGNLSP